MQNDRQRAVDLILLCCAPWKGVGPQQVKLLPGNWFVPPGSNRGRRGGNEAAEASGGEGREGDLVSMQVVT
jgi:hypothetical protein